MVTKKTKEWEAFNDLSNIVEREPGEEDISKELCHTEESVDHPVGQPLCVIILRRTFNRLDPAKRRQQAIPEIKMFSHLFDSPYFYCILDQ